MIADTHPHSDTPVFVVVSDSVAPNAGRWTDALPNIWLPQDESVEVRAAGLISPLSLTSGTWRGAAGSFQHMSDQRGDPDAPEDPITAEVRELAKLAGYDGHVTLHSPELVWRKRGQLEYRCSARFDSTAFVRQTIIVVLILSKAVSADTAAD